MTTWVKAADLKAGDCVLGDSGLIYSVLQNRGRTPDGRTCLRMLAPSGDELFKVYDSHLPFRRA